MRGEKEKEESSYEKVENIVKDTMNLMESMDVVEKSKYVKLFNVDSKTLLGIQHPKVKTLAKQKNLKIPAFSLQKKNYPNYVTLKPRQFTKMSATTNHGAANTTAGFCTSIVLNKLSRETRERVANVMGIIDEELLVSDSEVDKEDDVDENASQDYPQYSQSQTDTLKCCTICNFTTRLKQEIDSHHIQHPKCLVCKKDVQEQ